MTPYKMRQLARDLLFLANFRTQEGNYADAGRLRSDAYMLRHKSDFSTIV